MLATIKINSTFKDYFNELEYEVDINSYSDIEFYLRGVHPKFNNYIRHLQSGMGGEGFAYVNGDLKLRYWSNESSASTFETNQLFRDFSAWYHIVLVNDRDNAVGSEAVRLYVNGQRVTSFAVNNISGRKSQDTMVNASSFLWMIQRFTSGTVHGDAYMAEIVFLDGTATDCNSFGEFNSSGIWIPKDVSGLTFGTNGFHIDGRDSSDLGDDESGQGNDFTTSGLSTDDQRSDSPTNNHATLNPLINSYPTYANGNLEASMTVSNKWSKAFYIGKREKWMKLL